MSMELMVGLEIHVELATASKMFCACPSRFGATPNSLSCPVCTGQPGALPLINAAAVEMGLRLGLALGGEPAKRLSFDRKNYFYPDLPKGYQITQRRETVIRGGALVIRDGAGFRPVRIREAHLEEDAGKLEHRKKDGISLVDLNRSGVPLLEVVTEPELHSGEEAADFMRRLRDLAVWLGVSHGRMQEGNLRADVNVSLCIDGVPGGRTEIKNVGSFRDAARAIAAEEARQRELYRKGLPVEPCTLRYDADRQTVAVMRRKEGEREYRYSPEPDLPPAALPSAWVESLRRSLGPLPWEKEQAYLAAGLERDWIDTLLSDRPAAELFDRTVALGAPPRSAAAWILGDAAAIARKNGLNGPIPTPPETFAELIRMVEDGALSRPAARTVLEQVFHGGSPKEAACSLGLEQAGEEELRRAVKETLARGGKALADYRAGKTKAFAALMGQTMGLLRGRGDPQTVTRLLKEALDWDGGK